jgi:trehalose/maltose transport system permease protein
MAALIAVDVWKSTPFAALLLLAGLQMLPRDCYEAARVDGVPPLTTFLRITLPLMKPALAVAVIFRALDAMRIFDLVYVLTGSNRETMTMAVYARQQLIDFQDFGMGSAAATLLFLVIALLTVVYVMAVRLRVSDRSAVAG